jgi:hypothetical protein
MGQWKLFAWVVGSMKVFGDDTPLRPAGVATWQMPSQRIGGSHLLAICAETSLPMAAQSGGCRATTARPNAATVAPHKLSCTLSLGILLVLWMLVEPLARKKMSDKGKAISGLVLPDHFDADPRLLACRIGRNSH